MPAREPSRAARVVVVDVLEARGRIWLQHLEAAGHQARWAGVAERAVGDVSAFDADVCVVAELPLELVRDLRALDASVQLVLVTGTLADPRALAAFGVHAWHRPDVPTEILMAAVASAARRRRELADMRLHEETLQRVLQLAAGLGRLRSPAELAHLAVEAFVGTFSPHTGAPSGAFAVRTGADAPVQYLGAGRFAATRGELDLPDSVVEAMAPAFSSGIQIARGEGWIVLGVRATEGVCGALFVERVHVPPALDDLCSIFAELLGQALANAVLFQRSTLDALTGLHSRAYGLQRLAETLSLAARHPSRTSVLVLDVDHFKSVNDAWGHAAGDVVLASLAATIRSTCRDSDIAVRLGGEEFLVVLPRTDEDAAAVAAERLRRAVAAWRGHHLGHLLQATVSIGVAAAEAAERDPVALVSRADDALYVAKREGRNRVMRAG